MRKSGSEYQVILAFLTLNMLEFLSYTALMWGYGLLLNMFIITREELFGEHAAPDVVIFGLVYCPYVIIPLLVMLRVASTPVFHLDSKKHE